MKKSLVQLAFNLSPKPGFQLTRSATVPNDDDASIFFSIQTPEFFFHTGDIVDNLMTFGLLTYQSFMDLHFTYTMYTKLMRNF